MIEHVVQFGIAALGARGLAVGLDADEPGDTRTRPAMSQALKPDGNKTHVTRMITSGVSDYLNVRGFKPVETEVPVARGWVADVAGVCVPTRTEAMAIGLLPRSGRGGPRDHGRREELYNALPAPITALVEIKASRADFLGDRKWKLDRPATLCYVAAPTGVMRESEWPAGWGVLLCSKKHGIVLECLRVPDVRALSDTLTMWLIHEIAVRRDHRTSLRWLRDIRSQACKRETEVRQSVRVDSVVHAVEALLNGGCETVEMACRLYSIPNRTRIVDSLNRIAKLAPSQKGDPT